MDLCTAFLPNVVADFIELEHTRNPEPSTEQLNLFEEDAQQE